MIENALLGGEFDVAPDAILDPIADSSAPRLPVLMSTGRCALRTIAAALQRRGSAVLLPAFICQSVIDPFSEAGVPVEFYPIDTSMQIDLPAMAKTLRANPDAALLFVNYFGFPPRATQLRMLRQEARQRLVIEDCSHGSWIESEKPAVGAVGNVVLSSLRKYLPLPDGCAFLDRSGIVKPQLDGSAPSYVAQRHVGAQLKHVYLRETAPDATMESTYLKLFSEAERSIEASRKSHRISPVAKRLLRGLDRRQFMTRRRANFRALLQALSADRRLRAHLEPLITSLPAGVSPLALPIRVKGAGRRDRLRSSLAGQRLFCAVHWPAPASVDPVRFPEAVTLSSEILSLPVDQRHGPPEMKEIARRLAMAFAGQ